MFDGVGDRVSRGTRVSGSASILQLCLLAWEGLCAAYTFLVREQDTGSSSRIGVAAETRNMANFGRFCVSWKWPKHMMLIRQTPLRTSVHGSVSNVATVSVSGCKLSHPEPQPCSICYTSH